MYRYRSSECDGNITERIIGSDISDTYVSFDVGRG